MITCDDLVGDWLPGILVLEPEGEEENTMIDPQLTIRKDGNSYFGLFTGDDLEFEVTCEPLSARRLRINFTRRHNGGAHTTEYSGRVISIRPRGSVAVIKGRFRTDRPRFLEALEGGERRVRNGDWQTERPT